jgi:hypothetical protein
MIHASLFCNTLSAISFFQRAKNPAVQTTGFFYTVWSKVASGVSNSPL